MSKGFTLINFLRKTIKVRPLGFTLIELLVVIAVSVVVGFLLMGVLVNSTGVFYKESSKFNQGIDSNGTLSDFKSSVKESLGIVAAYTPSGGPTYTSGATVLVIKLPAVDAAGNIITGTFDYNVFYVNQNKLRVKAFPNVLSKRAKIDKVLANEVQAIIFEYYDKVGQVASPSSATKVKLSLSLRQRVSTGFETYVSTSEANLRND